MIARGAAFAFRKSITTLPMRRFLGAAFALSSLVTPFFLGAVVGGVASGRVPPGIAAGRRRDQLGQPDLGARRRARRAGLRLPRRGLPLRDAAPRGPRRARGRVPHPGAGHRRGDRRRRARGVVRAARRRAAALGRADRPGAAGGRAVRARRAWPRSCCWCARRYALRAGRLGARRRHDPHRLGGRPSTPTCCRRT